MGQLLIGQTPSGTREPPKIHWELPGGLVAPRPDRKGEEDGDYEMEKDHNKE